MLFAYKAMNPLGRTVKGQMEAANLIDLEMRLKRIDLDFIHGDPVKQGGLLQSAKVPRRELINFCFHLEQLTRAGVPILEGLTDLRDSLSHPQFKEVIAGMIESIEGGKTLSQSMLEHPRTFDEVFISLVRAGEDSGNLPGVLQNLVDSLKWQDELASQTKKLVMYPAFLGVVVVGVTFFMMIYLVPKMAGFIKNMGQELPLQTKVLMATSDFFVNFWYVIIFVPVLLAIILVIAVRTNSVARYRFDGFKLSIPYIGDILRKIILSRFSSVFAMLYASGISIIDSIQTTENVVGNVVIRDGLKRAGQLIADGKNVTAAFEDIQLFPPLVIRMLRVGENTGGLDKALINVGYFYNRDVKESIERVQTMIEPAMTMIVGLILGWVIIAVLGPIYDIIAKLKT